MEIGNKIIELRKKNNLSQEDLAEKVGVTRQTISKWELGETTPDIKQAKILSSIFSISLDELVNNNIKDILIEKTSNTEKLAGLILKLFKIFIYFIIIGTVLGILLIVVFQVSTKESRTPDSKMSITCNLHDEDYSYEFEFVSESGQIITAGGSGYLSNITDISKYGDAYQAIDIIDSYVKNNGGSCIKSEIESIK